MAVLVRDRHMRTSVGVQNLLDDLWVRGRRQVTVSGFCRALTGSSGSGFRVQGSGLRGRDTHIDKPNAILFGGGHEPVGEEWPVLELCHRVHRERALFVLLVPSFASVRAR
eukprot:1096007-Rhodomonas_salina.2